jgi:hypothetical protein
VSDPPSNSPADVGYLDQNPGAALPPAAPRHVAKRCSSCAAPIFWAQLLDEKGERIRRQDGRGWKSIPVNLGHDPKGNVVLWDRKGQGIVGRVLRQGEAPPPGTKLRTSHFATCPDAKKHRKRRA